MNELTISIDVKDSKPLYEQIYEYIKGEIQGGSISFHEKLPSTRALARHLQISRSTVDAAYEQLMSEGYIEAVPCRGYFVSGIEELYQFTETVSEPVKIMQEKKDRREDYRIDFSPNGIDLDSFPYNTWRKLTRNTLQYDNKELFQPGAAEGEPEFRTAICKYLHQARGVRCRPEQIIVGAGNDYLMMLLSRIIGKNHVIAMENPTYRHAYGTFTGLSYEVVTVNMDKNGILVKELEKTNADIAYVMPSHQYPLGIVMPIKRRLELLRWAAAGSEKYIIEDDYDSEFRYKGKPIPALQGFDSNDRVIYTGTFSKSIAPAIRVSYMVLPEKLLEKYREYSEFYTSTVSRIDQTLINSFLSEGYFERHLNKMRAIYKNKHDVLLQEMKKLSTVCTVSGENAGVHILVSFHNGLQERELIERAASRKIKVYGLSEYYIKSSPGESATIIMGYANLKEDEIREAVSELVEVWT